MGLSGAWGQDLGVRELGQEGRRAGTAPALEGCAGGGVGGLKAVGLGRTLEVTRVGPLGLVGCKASRGSRGSTAARRETRSPLHRPLCFPVFQTGHHNSQHFQQDSPSQGLEILVQTPVGKSKRRAGGRGGALQLRDPQSRPRPRVTPPQPVVRSRCCTHSPVPRQPPRSRGPGAAP